MRILAHWGLRERPFETTFDPLFFFESPVHGEAVARLRLVAEDGDMCFGLLTGEIGSGKTFAAVVFAASLETRRFAPVFVASSNLGFACILDQVNCALRGESPTGEVASRYELLIEFRRLLERRITRRGQHLVLVLDEAQELSERDLAELRCLTNEVSAGRGTMSIVLVGQPELRARVRAMPAVDTRIGLRYHLGYLGADDVDLYVAHRLRAAGHATGRLFTPSAVALLGRRSRGVPRDINRLAKLALFRASCRGGRIAGEEDVASVAEDLARNAA